MKEFILATAFILISLSMASYFWINAMLKKFYSPEFGKLFSAGLFMFGVAIVFMCFY